MVNLASILGLLGAITAATIFIPQVWTSYKTKRTRDVAWYMIGIGLLNATFWTFYGFLKTDPFIYVTNIIGFVNSFLLLVLKKKYG